MPPKGSAGEQPRQKVWEKVRSNAPAHGIFRSRAALFVGGLRRHPSAKLLAGGPSAAGRSPATAPGRALRTRARRRRSRSASSSLSRNALPANGMEGNIVLDGRGCQGFCKGALLCHPRGSGDPYSRRLREIFDSVASHFQSWLWVPAFAGTTLSPSSPGGDVIHSSSCPRLSRASR
jgi:hypothetical protein